MTGEVRRPAAASEDSSALLTWLTSALNAAAGDVAAIRAVMTFAPPDSELPVGIEAVADKTTLASTPTVAEPRLVDAPEATPRVVIIEPDSRPYSPPKGDREMKVGVTFSFSEDVAGRVEAPYLSNGALTLEAMVAVKAGMPISVVLCVPAAEVEKAPKPLKIAVALLWTTVMDDCDP